MLRTLTVEPTQKETKNTGPSAEPQLVARPKCFVERRSHPRFPFTAATQAVEISSGARIDARTTDLGAGGCYVDAMNPFPVGTAMQLRLTKDGKSFRADAKVAYCQVGVGMGLLFSAASPEQLLTLQGWIDEVRGDVPPEVHSLEQDERALSKNNPKDEQHYALEELLILLMRKGLLTEEEGEPILRRLIHSTPI